MDETLPKAIWEGTVLVMGVPLKCFVLDDGRRIIDADSVAAFFTAMEEAGATPGVHDGALEFARFCSGEGVPTSEMK